MEPAPAKLLVVDDHADTRQALLLALNLEGFHVDLAANGREALDYLRDHAPPDEILLDMLMPVVDGWHFLQELRALALSPRPRILVMTAVPAISPEWAKGHGCDGCLNKPVRIPELIAEIRRVLAL